MNTLKQDDELRAVLKAHPRVLRRLLEHSGLLRLSYVSEKAHDTAFNEGRRNEGLWLLHECLKVAPDAAALLLLLKEDGA